jgi:septal ring factor EnvC (AmiA/AmiB activator)
MNTPITITPYELWNIIIGICAALITISGAVMVIINVANKAKAPNKKQDERIEKLEADVKQINKRLDDGSKHMNQDDEQIRQIEANMSATNKIIIESLQALTSHAIDGNNIQELRDAKRNLDEYLINKV